MSDDLISGKWQQITGRLHEVYGGLTGSAWEEVSGNWQKASGFIQEKFGETKEVVEEKIKALLEE